MQRRVNERLLGDQLDRAKGRRGVARLRAVLHVGPAPTRSELEDLTLELLARYGFPRPQTDAVLTDLDRRIEVDFLFPELRLVIETDGARYHGTRLARESDARKQAIIEAGGYRVVRLSWDQVTSEGELTARRLGRVVAEQATLASGLNPVSPVPP